MDIRQIELFVAAAEEQHFTRAAKRENIVQSGLSVAIRGLEEELGTRLFVRNTRRVDLSEAGRIFLPEARRILLATKAAKDAVAAVRGSLSGRLMIGSIQSLQPFLDLPLLLQNFHERHPGVEIAVRESYPEALAEGLRNGRLDLAFAPLSAAPLAGLSIEPLFASEMVVAISPNDARAKRKRITLPELSEDIFVDFSPRWGTRVLVDRIFAMENLGRHTGFEVENFELLFQFVARGFGIAVVPQATVEGRGLPSLRIRPVQSGPSLPPWEIGLVRVKSASRLPPNPPAETFRAMLMDVIGTRDKPRPRSTVEPTPVRAKRGSGSS